MRYGLTQAELSRILAIFRANAHAEQVWIFGSRATGQHRPYSDIDLAVTGSRLSRSEVLRLSSALDDLPLPFAFDLIHWNELIPEALREQISKHGKLLYERNSTLVGQE